MKSKLVLNTAWMTFGQGIYAACQWATLIILARFGGAGLVGDYALGLAVTTPVMIFSQLQIRYVLVTDVADQYTFDDYFFVRLMTTGLAGLFLVALTLLGDFSGGVGAIILAVGVAKAFENLSDLLYGVSQRHERLDLIGISLALRAVLGLAALTAGLYLGGRLFVGVLAMAVAWALVLVIYDRRVTASWRQQAEGRRPRPAAEVLRRALQLTRLGLPLGVTVMLGSLNTNIPRYFIASQVGQQGLGALAAMAYFVIAGDLVVNAIGQSASSRLATSFASGAIAAFRRLLGYMVLTSAMLGAAGVLTALVLGPSILRLLYGAGFAQNTDIFVWVMIAGAIGYLASPLGYALTAMRWFRLQPMILGTVVAVNVLGCYLLVSRYGLGGAVGAWIGSLLCQALLFSVVVQRRLRRERRPQSGAAHHGLIASGRSE